MARYLLQPVRWFDTRTCNWSCAYADVAYQGTLIRVFATSNCTRIAELRRGVDQATIFSIGISPSNTMLAVTSDKSTLHVFDLPLSHGSVGGSYPSQKRSASPISPIEDNTNKWGILGKIPLLPRMFSDVYSFASQRFEIGDEPLTGTPYLPALGTSAVRPPKGVIGWVSDHTILVIGAGKDGRWERFQLGEVDDGKRILSRTGWKRYLGGG